MLLNCPSLVEAKLHPGQTGCDRHGPKDESIGRRKPLFIDKMPDNFHHLGIIHLMMATATIIDVRQEPMAGYFSIMKQLFASGQEFTCSIEDIAATTGPISS
jgi:hypothetical protein